VTEQNVEVVSRFFAAFVRGDVDAALGSFGPELEVHDHDLPDAGEYRGLDGLLRWQGDWERVWESWQWIPIEFVQSGDRVVAVLRLHARGRRSGVDLERLDGMVWTVRDGKCVRLDYYGSREQALEAAGLLE
jgi:ketosteroid isomerase-like protein